MIINTSVYNVTSFIPSHPGRSAIVRGCGMDATAMFQSVGAHEGSQALNALASLKIGTLAQ
jgi:cytochrome b involved in lipid metabolism